MAELLDFPKPAGAGAALYYWDGAAWQKWTGSLIDHKVNLYAWDGSVWVSVNCDNDGRLIVANIVRELPAGTKNIGDVDVASLPSTVIAGMTSLPTGTNNIGKVNIQSAPTLVVQSTNADKIFGYELRLFGIYSNLNLAAGDNTLNGGAVGAGKVWIVTSIGFIYVGTPPTFVDIQVGLGGSAVLLRREFAPASNRFYSEKGQFIYSAGDNPRLFVSGASAGDDLYLYFNGWQMDAT